MASGLVGLSLAGGVRGGLGSGLSGVGWCRFCSWAQLRGGGGVGRQGSAECGRTTVSRSRTAPSPGWLSRPERGKEGTGSSGHAALHKGAGDLLHRMAGMWKGKSRNNFTTRYVLLPASLSVTCLYCWTSGFKGPCGACLVILAQVDSD